VTAHQIWKAEVRTQVSYVLRLDFTLQHCICAIHVWLHDKRWGQRIGWRYSVGKAARNEWWRHGNKLWRRHLSLCVPPTCPLRQTRSVAHVHKGFTSFPQRSASVSGCKRRRNPRACWPRSLTAACHLSTILATSYHYRCMPVHRLSSSISSLISASLHHCCQTRSRLIDRRTVDFRVDQIIATLLYWQNVTWQLNDEGNNSNNNNNNNELYNVWVWYDQNDN